MSKSAHLFILSPLISTKLELKHSPMNSTSNDTFSSHYNGTENAAVCSRPTGCVYNLSIKTTTHRKSSTHISSISIKTPLHIYLLQINQKKSITPNFIKMHNHLNPPLQFIKKNIDFRAKIKLTKRTHIINYTIWYCLLLGNNYSNSKKRQIKYYIMS